MMGQGKHGEMTSWGVKAKGWGGSKSLSLQPPAPPDLLRDAWGKEGGEKMSKETYHIQGLPMVVAEGYQRRKENMI